MSVDAIKRVLSNLRELPAMPNVVTKALSVIKNPMSGAADLAKTVENDQSITTELLKIVNSSYFRLSTRVATVQQAISLLGFNDVKSIVLSCAMKPMMTTQGGKDIWEHAINTAIAAETIARKLGRSDFDECFALGLLHDIGKIVFELYDRKQAGDAIRLARSGTNVLMAEKMVFGFDHTEVGYILANRWQIPRQIISIIRCHHKPQASEFKTVAHIVYLADRIVKDNMPNPIIEPDIARTMDFEITGLESFRRMVLDKAKLLLINLNSL